VSNEVNISELVYGTLDPGLWVEWYLGRPYYDQARRKVAFFTIVPDPAIPFGDGVTIEIAPGHVDMEITRTWNTVWSSLKPDNSIDHAFQRNVRIANPADQTSAYHLLVAETDN
jgi:hypothetical protein